MRPFKFFFLTALSIMVFFFIAKFVISAFIIAALLSAVYFLFQKIRGFFYRLDWSDHDRYGHREREYAYDFSKWGNEPKSFNFNEPLFHERKRRNDYRTITIG